MEDDLLLLAEDKGGTEARWNRPRKRGFLLRADTDVDWFKSKVQVTRRESPGY